MVKQKVYHGTNAQFNEFDVSFKGTNTGVNNTVHGIFFADDIEIAKNFGNRVIEATITMNKTADFRLQSIFTNKEQAPMICQILFGKYYSPDVALRKIDEEIGLGEVREMYDMLYSNDAHEELRRMVMTASYRTSVIAIQSSI